MILPDVNMLVDAHRADATDHDRYADWLALTARPNYVPVAAGARHWQLFTALCRRIG